MKIYRIIFTTLLSFVPFQQLAVSSSELLVANGDEIIEEIKIKKVNKKGDLVVKFCDCLTDLSGYVEVQGKKFLVSDADVVKGKKIIWKDTNLSKTKRKSISTDNLYSEGKVIGDGNCGIGIVPLLVIGAGLAIGGASGGGSGSSSSN